ncbi:SMC-Scp complex subunit ScpB [Algiphilus sp.]|uniref:SMC-Scp complex subunit ScpB n=1 Tax=Algiphilus sp. TaxID=1872431 RepID=UPI0025B7FA20|nr:SMC-Scp complex subunit ScpB [Algiphilus sp.]
MSEEPTPDSAPDGVPDSAAEAASDLENILEALLLASDQPLSLNALQSLLAEDGAGDRKALRAALERLQRRYEGTALALTEVASGWRISVVDDYAAWVHRLWQEKPPKLSRALLETLAIICYRQPVTRSDIEEIRGVTVSANILRTLGERGWVREAGVREVPGRPALLITTSQLLDDLGLRSLDELPSLPEIKDPEQLEAALARLAEKRGISLDAPAADDDGEGAAIDDDASSSGDPLDADDDAGAAAPDADGASPGPERLH